MSFDLQAALRRLKPQRRSGALTRRNDDDLTFVEEPVRARAELMLDTCGYIDVLQGHTPAAVDALLATRICNHSAIGLAELVHLFGRLDPDHRGTMGTLRELSGVIAEIPPHRLTPPSMRTLGEAGLLAGLAERLTGQREGRGQALFNDAVLYLHALERGCVVLTRNLREFDFFDQLVPSGRVLFYRQA